MLIEKKIKINAEALKYFSIANFKKRSKQYKDALANYDKAIKAFPKFAEAYFKRANVKILLLDNEGAIEDYNKSIELNPNFAEAYNNRGLAKISSGDNDGGNLDFLQAGMLGYFKAYDVNKQYCF
jgi:tetratricopeptide (TPR) repeat protein